MKRHDLWLSGVCLLALTTPALAQAPATAPQATPPAVPAIPAAPAPASPAAAPAKPPVAPATPVPPPAPAATAAGPAPAATAPAAAAPTSVAPAAATPATPGTPDLQLAPDPKLAPAIPLAPAPAGFDASADAYPPLPDIPLGPTGDAWLTPLLDLRLGARDQLIGSDGFDAFSDDDQLPTFQVAAGVCLHDLSDGGAISGVASLELSGSSASLRGLPTELGVMRIGVGPELRLPFGERLYFSGRLSPQAVRVSSQLEEPVNSMTFSQASWAFGVDAAVGVSLRFAQLRPRGLDRPLGLFLHLEGGYLWTSSVEQDLSAGADGPVRSAPLALEALALHGLSLGASVGIGY